MKRIAAPLPLLLIFGSIHGAYLPQSSSTTTTEGANRDLPIHINSEVYQKSRERILQQNLNSSSLIIDHPILKGSGNDHPNPSHNPVELPSPSLVPHQLLVNASASATTIRSVITNATLGNKTSYNVTTGKQSHHTKHPNSRLVAVIKFDKNKFSFSKQYVKEKVKSDITLSTQQPLTVPTKLYSRSAYKPAVLNQQDAQTTKPSETVKMQLPTEYSNGSIFTEKNNYSQIQETGTYTTTQHVKLEELENELSHSKDKPNKDLLLAISILQHHMFPEFEDSSEENQDINLKRDEIKKLRTKDSDLKNETKRHHSLEFKIEVNDAFAAKDQEELTNITNLADLSTMAPTKDVSDVTREKLRNVNSGFYKIKSLTHLPWYLLVMDGNCSIIRHRMSAFVTFLKAALSAKLSTTYEDIYVPSVYCDKTFMVNISLDADKYPHAEQTLRSLAEANTTLLEISGEIFFLEKVLSRKSSFGKSVPCFDRDADVEIVIYIAIGCMCVFILLSLVTVALIKLCRQEAANYDTEKLEPITRLNFPIRRPRVIYSPTFSQSLNPDKFPLSSHEEPIAQSEGGVAPCSSTISLGGGPYSEEDNQEPISSSSSNEKKLLEQVQEEEEEEMEDYQDEDEDLDETEYEEETEEEGPSTSRLSGGLRSLCLPTSQEISGDPQLSFENPCYNR